MSSGHLPSETTADQDVKTVHSLEQEVAAHHQRYLHSAGAFDIYRK
jgi:hypothetical protein